MADRNENLHAIMVSFPFQGHITPFVHLAMKLASNGITITFVHTEFINDQIIKSKKNNSGEEVDIFADARKSGLDIRYRTIGDGLPLEFDRTPHGEQYWESILRVLPAQIDELVGDLVRSDPSSGYFLIADTFYVWPEGIANKYNLVNVSFWTESAMVFTLYYHLDLLRINGHFASTDNRKDTIDYIPGVKAIEPKDLMSYLQDTDLSTIAHQIVFQAFERVKRADLIVANVVQELEHEAISAIQQKQPIYPIGPFFSPGFTSCNVAVNLRPESECIVWLNQKLSGSVLYVSFGSLVQIDNQVLMEIAHGLLLSGVNFVWVFRPNMVDSDDTNSLPLSFEDEVRERGLIVPWCNQVRVISHPAIGGFLTHCGWNSILESIWCGVPLICFPSFTDQLTNRKLVVDNWKIGINLFDRKSITREEVAEKISHLMSPKTSGSQRKAVVQVKRTLENALSIDGSSEKNFAQFIEDVKVKIHRKQQDLSSSHA